MTARFAVSHPVLSAVMVRVDRAPLVAAVSEGGGMGCLDGLRCFADDSARSATMVVMVCNQVDGHERKGSTGGGLWWPTSCDVAD